MLRCVCLGVDARIAVPSQNLESFLETYQGIGNPHAIFVGCERDEWVRVAGNASIVVATIFKSVSILRDITRAYPRVVPAYYVQDYEPFFFVANSSNHREASASYELIPGALLFAKTQWLVDIVNEHHGLHVHKVVPSLDHDVYHPLASRGDESIEICAMIRPKTPRRGAERTMRVLGTIRQRHGEKVGIHIFGCENDDPEFREIASLAKCQNHGILDREGVAAVLALSHIFIDLSDYQAFGRTGLEAMACACAVINPLRGGTSEYSVHGETALLVDTGDESACLAAVERLVVDRDLRVRLSESGLRAAAGYSAKAAAESELRILREGVETYRALIADPERGIDTEFPSYQGSTSSEGYYRFKRRVDKLIRNPRKFMKDSRFGPGARTRRKAIVSCKCCVRGLEYILIKRVE